jgi:hypothetical protein
MAGRARATHREFIEGGLANHHGFGGLEFADDRRIIERNIARQDVAEAVVGMPLVEKLSLRNTGCPKTKAAWISLIEQSR